MLVRISIDRAVHDYLSNKISNKEQKSPEYNLSDIYIIRYVNYFHACIAVSFCDTLQRVLSRLTRRNKWQNMHVITNHDRHSDENYICMPTKMYQVIRNILYRLATADKFRCCALKINFLKLPVFELYIHALKLF